jgi:hypothetical protein
MTDDMIYPNEPMQYVGLHTAYSSTRGMHTLAGQERNRGSESGMMHYSRWLKSTRFVYQLASSFVAECWLRIDLDKSRYGYM